MDKAEKIVEQYLISKSYETVVYEPTVNATPDFLVDGRIAVEVTRLNIHYDDHLLEPYAHVQHLIPVYQSLRNMLLKFGPSIDGESWLVFFSLMHPFKGWGAIRAAVKSELDAFYACKNRENCSFKVAESIEITLRKAHKQMETFYFYAGGSEDFQGCLVISEMNRNIQIAADLKSVKIKSEKEKYDQWWLALVDGIGCGISGQDFEQLLSMPLNRLDWNKILLVNPLVPTEAHEF